MSGLENLLGPRVQGKSGPVNVSSFSKGVVGIYFSAHWCPPCRGFTPVLAQCYNALKAKGKEFEVVFVSSDRDEESFAEYYAEMPWLTIGFDSDVKDKLSTTFQVRGIPTLVLVDGATGKTITMDGRSKVASDPEGENFPWV